MDVEKLKIFIQVYQKQSFASVAASNNLAASSITRVINALEDELENKLFNRTTRRVVPTEQGHHLFKKVVRLVDEFDALKEEMVEKERPINGTVRISCPVSFASVYLNDLISDFLQLYPELNIEALVTDQRVDLLSERIDLAIRFGRLSDSSAVATKLVALDYVVCCSPEYRKKNKEPILPSDLSDHKCLTFLFPKFNQGWKFRKDGEVEIVRVYSKVSMTSAMSLIELAKKGLGLALLPRILIRNDLKTKKLVEVFSQYEVTATEFGANVWLVYPSKSYMPRKTKIFKKFLVEQIKF